MSENLTQKYGLVQQITSEHWFSNPAGKQGYEVILLEKVGDGGTRYYYSLRPGETLRLAERILSNYIPMQVDIRRARALEISRDFNTRERGRKISVNLKVRYHVTDK